MPDDWQAYVVFAPQGCNLKVLVDVVSTNWHVEKVFETAKLEVGLDNYEVRSAVGWTRHITLSMWALALLTVARTAKLDRPTTPNKYPGPKNLANFRRSRGLAED